MSLSGDVCIVRLSGWEDWWAEVRTGSFKTYVSVVLFFLSAVLASPIARSLFFLARKFSPSKWIWPDDARELMMWQTSLLCRAGLLWIAIAVSRLSLMLCMWPQWLFGISFMIWMDAAGNVLREVIVRKGTVGYSEHEKPGRITLLYEGTTLAKLMLLVLIVYIYYVSPVVNENVTMRLLFSTGFFLSIALSTLPLLRNFVGGHHMFLASMLHLDSRIRVHGTSTPAGTVSDTPLGFIVLDTEDRTRTFIPAGETITDTTEVFHSRAWPLQLDIRLPSSVPSSKVRAFVQDLDELLLFQGTRPSAATTASIDGSPDLSSFSTRASSLGGGIPAPRGRASNAKRKALFDLATQEENSVFERARGHESYIAVLDSTRWVIRFHTFVKEKNKTRFRQTRAWYIETITRMLETQQLAYSPQTKIAGNADESL